MKAFLILGATAVGLILLWSVYSKKRTAAQLAASKASNAAADATACAAKGGKFTGSADNGINSCELPNIPIAQIPSGSYGSCPDRVSCAGQSNPAYAGYGLTHPSNVPTPPANGIFTPASGYVTGPTSLFSPTISKTTCQSPPFCH